MYIVCIIFYFLDVQQKRLCNNFEGNTRAKNSISVHQTKNKFVDISNSVTVLQ